MIFPKYSTILFNILLINCVIIQVVTIITTLVTISFHFIEHGYALLLFINIILLTTLVLDSIVTAVIKLSNNKLINIYLNDPFLLLFHLLNIFVVIAFISLYLLQLDIINIDLIYCFISIFLIFLLTFLLNNYKHIVFIAAVVFLYISMILTIVYFYKVSDTWVFLLILFISLIGVFTIISVFTDDIWQPYLIGKFMIGEPVLLDEEAFIEIYIISLTIGFSIIVTLTNILNISFSLEHIFFYYWIGFCTIILIMLCSNLVYFIFYGVWLGLGTSYINKNNIELIFTLFSIGYYISFILLIMWN